MGWQADESGNQQQWHGVQVCARTHSLACSETRGWRGRAVRYSLGPRDTETRSQGREAWAVYEATPENGKCEADLHLRLSTEGFRFNRRRVRGSIRGRARGRARGRRATAHSVTPTDGPGGIGMFCRGPGGTVSIRRECAQRLLRAGRHRHAAETDPPAAARASKVRHGSFYKALSRAPWSPPARAKSVTREKLRGEAPMHCLRRPFTSAVLPRRGCGSAPWPRRGASAMPAASRCGCAAPLGSISTSLTGAPPSSFEWSPPSEPCHG